MSQRLIIDIVGGLRSQDGDFLETLSPRGGSFLVGSLHCTYTLLTNVFGPPTSDGDGYKTDAEWELYSTDYGWIYIYNWKNGISFLGTGGLNVEDILSWHIGSVNRDAPHTVFNALKRGVEVMQR